MLRAKSAIGATARLWVQKWQAFVLQAPCWQPQLPIPRPSKIFGHLPHAFLWVMFPWRNRSHAQRRNQPSRPALRMRRYRRRLLHDGENYFRLKARTDELECLLRAVELLRAIEPARADIEAALTLLFVELHDPVLAQAVALLILDHRRNAT